MAAAMKVMSLLSVLVLLAMAPGGEAQIGCNLVIPSCHLFVVNSGPLGRCCFVVKTLYSAAKTTPDRQRLCTCLKGFAQKYAAYISRVATLPSKCLVSIPYAISPSTDCSKVK